VQTLEAEFGPIDIYLFDQLLRGRIRPGDTVFDAGCGFGRNLVYLLRQGYEVFGVDADADAVAATYELAATLAPALSPDRFRIEPIEQTSFPSGFASVVIASAVLHFARDDDQFDAMVSELWRLLRPGGMLFCRLASTIGIESLVRPLAPSGRRFRLPDGTDRYLVDEALLVERTYALGGQLLDPIKTTVVQDQRSMTTWVVRKTDGPRLS
jgi:tellurite methyltransferase